MKRLVLFAMLMLALAASASAEEWRPSYTDRPLDFSLRFGRHELDLERAGAVIDTTVDRVGIAWRERFGERLQLGWYADYAALTQDNNAVTAGRELTGYHAGVSLDLELLRLGRAALLLQATVGYQRVDDDDGAQEVVISWTEPRIRLGASGPLAGALRGYAGVSYAAIDGEERLSGTMNATGALDQTDHGGGFVGLELDLERDGYVGLAAESGMERAVRIYFGRRY